MQKILGVKHQQHIGTTSVSVQGVTVQYNSTRALEDVSFELQVGERVAVVGPNGAGKSTLFKVIAGILRPTRGQVNLFGFEPKGHICVAYVPQRSQLDLSFPVNVRDVVMMGRTGKIGIFRWPTRQDRELVQECLELVDMAGLADRHISELSGGQIQRMFIARALAQEAEIMLMDEPLTGLDLKSQEDIFRILDELRRRKVTVLVATHDLNQAAERFDLVMLLNRRLIGLGLPREVFTPELLKQAYGGQLRLVETADGHMVLADTGCECQG
ncbi:MAG: metal ABC transporter ATP-binding protein [Anaerolineae bacterium]